MSVWGICLCSVCCLCGIFVVCVLIIWYLFGVLFECICSVHMYVCVICDIFMVCLWSESVCVLCGVFVVFGDCDLCI